MKRLSAKDIRAVMDWNNTIAALRAGHLGPHPIVQDIILNHEAFSLFGRGVILPGRGAGMKIASIFPPNIDQSPSQPVEDAVFLVISEGTKQISGVLDGPEITRWKTAADSALGSQILSAPDSKTLLVLGAGPIALALAEAHLSVRSSLRRALLWNRTPGKIDPIAKRLLQLGVQVEIVTDLNAAIPEADIITSATSATSPLIAGSLLRPGCHIDLVGSYRPDMREADDAAIKRARVFVDNREAAITQSGDICQPITNGTIQASHVEGDLFDLVGVEFTRNADDITLYKNAGGAHFDLLVALAALRQQS